MSPPTVYLVSGAGRGIGFGIITALVKRPNVYIYAGARSPSTATQLNELASAHPGVLEVVQLASASVPDAEAIAKLIEAKFGKLDVIIANAGIADYLGPVAATPLEEMRTHFEVNTLGPLVLFQQLQQLLFKSETRKFLLMSTAAGSITTPPPFPVGAYGASKAAANYLFVKLHAEHEADGLVVFIVHPGIVQSDRGNEIARQFGMVDGALVTIGDSVAGMLQQLDGATRADTGGKFWDNEGAQLQW